MALMAILIQNIGYLVTKAKEISGYGYEDEAVDPKIKDLFDILGQAFPLGGTVCLFIAVFGLEFDSTSAKLLVPLPILGFFWEGRKWLAILNTYITIDDILSIEGNNTKMFDFEILAVLCSIHCFRTI